MAGFCLAVNRSRREIKYRGTSRRRRRQRQQNERWRQAPNAIRRCVVVAQRTFRRRKPERVCFGSPRAVRTSLGVGPRQAGRRVVMMRPIAGFSHLSRPRPSRFRLRRRFVVSRPRVGRRARSQQSAGKETPGLRRRSAVFLLCAVDSRAVVLLFGVIFVSLLVSVSPSLAPLTAGRADGLRGSAMF
jgi:hypothetical protein